MRYDAVEFMNHTFNLGQKQAHTFFPNQCWSNSFFLHKKTYKTTITLSGSGHVHTYFQPFSVDNYWKWNIPTTPYVIYLLLLLCLCQISNNIKVIQLWNFRLDTQNLNIFSWNSIAQKTNKILDKNLLYLHRCTIQYAIVQSKNRKNDTTIWQKY